MVSLQISRSPKRLSLFSWYNPPPLVGMSLRPRLCPANTTLRPRLRSRRHSCVPQALPSSGSECSARMAAGRRVGLGPRSRPAMAPWKKKRLRKRRTGASQARDSDSEDGEFEIQAEDDARARKVITRGSWSGPRPAPFRPSVSLIAGPYWVSSHRGRGPVYTANRKCMCGRSA